MIDFSKILPVVAAVVLPGTGSTTGASTTGATTTGATTAGGSCS